MILAVLSMLGACTIGGTVSDEGPVERARVIATSGNESYLRLTDAQGNFCFDTLNSGNYYLTVQKPGYLEYDYPVTLAVEDDSPIEPLNVHLTRYASLAGTVLSPDGEIQPGARVTLWQRARGNAEEAESTEADEHGAFRFSQLTPGTYYLSAELEDDNRYVLAIADSHGRFATEKTTATFYSESFSFAGATALELKAGRRLERLVLSLQRAQLHRITGRITVPTHQSFLYLSGETDGATGRPIPIARDGTFTKSGVAPGKYNLSLNDGDRKIARQDVDLTLGDALNVTLEPIEILTVPAVFRTEGKGPAFRPVTSKGGGELTMLAREGSDNAWTLTAAPDGSYHFSMVESGTYRLQIVLGGQKFYVKGIAYDGRPVSAEKIELHGEPSTGLEVTLSPNVAEVYGKVTGLKAADSDLTIVLVDGARIVDETGTDQKGRFKMSTVPPGKYRILAIEGFDDDNWTADVAKALQAQSTYLELQENDHKQVEIQAVSATEFALAIRENLH